MNDWVTISPLRRHREMKQIMTSDPMKPIYFLIIYNERDFVQINYPEDFREEKSIREQILPITSDEVELIVSQTRIEVGWCRFQHKNRESIERALEFNGVSARCGISLEQFQRNLAEIKEMRKHE